MNGKILLFMLMVSSFLYMDSLPIGFTEEEWSNRHLLRDMGRETDPPLGPVRNIAEYEPMQGVLIRYPFGISTTLIREMAEDVIIYCLVSNSYQSAAQNSMVSAGVNMENVEFIIGNTDSYWTRDYGPWWVVDGNGDVGIVDFTYNRPSRPNDNAAPSKVANHLDVPYYSADIVQTGGNYMTDGYGLSASTHIAYTENGCVDSNCNTSFSNTNCTYVSLPDDFCPEVDDIMLQYYGVSDYHVIGDPNDEYIDHIDCWGKFLSDSKLLIRSVPIDHAQYNEIEDIVEYFEGITTSNGDNWEIFRVSTPNNQPYTNSLILNNKVLVPISNNLSLDSQALAVYEEAMPNHEVLGFSGTWDSTDALHCRVKGIPDLSLYQYSSGDVNMDEVANVQDIIIIVNFILSVNTPSFIESNLADINSDNNINVQDIILLVNIILR
tara:strand:- start:28 stop:1335 length:1308 start_codon:yes stop_codon:yes gene_type:complete